MDKKGANKIIRQRTKPSIFDFCYIATRAHLRAFLKFKDHLKELNKPIRVLDLGCGQKPFETILSEVKIEKYVGVDFDSKRSKPDIVAPVDDLPIKDSSFDAIISSEVFEHTPDLKKAIKELRRVAKNGAIVYISTPFMFGEHGAPYDFQRITKYKYFELFKNDEILLVKETNSSLATLFFLSNVCWELITVLRMIPIVTPLFYFLNNCGALLFEALIHLAGFFGEKVFYKKKDWFRELFNGYFYTMPGGYDVIVKIEK